MMMRSCACPCMPLQVEGQFDKAALYTALGLPVPGAAQDTAGYASIVGPLQNCQVSYLSQVRSLQMPCAVMLVRVTTPGLPAPLSS